MMLYFEKYLNSSFNSDPSGVLTSCSSVSAINVFLIQSNILQIFSSLINKHNFYVGFLLCSSVSPVAICRFLSCLFSSGTHCIIMSPYAALDIQAQILDLPLA